MSYQKLKVFQLLPVHDKKIYSNSQEYIGSVGDEANTLKIHIYIYIKAVILQDLDHQLSLIHELLQSPSLQASYSKEELGMSS